MIFFGLFDSKLEAVRDVHLTDDGYYFTGLFKSKKGDFKIAICSHYYEQFNVFSSRIGFGTKEGFGGDRSLQSFGTHECLDKEGRGML